MGWKLFHQAVKIVVIVGNIHIRLGDENRHIGVLHLKYAVKVFHTVAAHHGKQQIGWHHACKQDAHIKRLNVPRHGNIGKSRHSHCQDQLEPGHAQHWDGQGQHVKAH